jgi:hypothetical protein
VQRDPGSLLSIHASVQRPLSFDFVLACNCSKGVLELQKPEAIRKEGVATGSLIIATSVPNDVPHA